MEYRSKDVLFCLSIPNRLLVAWHKKVAKPNDYLSLLNESIEDRVVAINEHSESLAQKLYKQAALVHNDGRKKAGRGRELLHECVFLLPNFVLRMPLQLNSCRLRFMSWSLTLHLQSKSWL